MLFSLAASAIMLLITAAVAVASPTLRARVCWVPAVFLVLGLCGAPTLGLNALSVVLAATACLGLKTRITTFLMSSLAVTVVSYGIGIAMSISWWRELFELREQYPYVSIGDRLAYETQERSNIGSLLRPTEAGLPKGGVDHLSVLEQHLETFGSLTPIRARKLMRLHEHFVDEFMDSPGFGVTRRFNRPSKYFIELRGNDPIPLPVADVSSLSASAETLDVLQPAQNGQGIAAAALEGMHDFSVLDFVNAVGYGYIRDRDHVAGFQEHQFSRMPDVPKDSDSWQIARLELISILKFDEPAAYIGEHLPRMDELRHAPTRPLDAFEKAALAALRRGEDLKIHSAGDRIYTLGSIRALKVCLDCHQGERGDLLGAFSYRLSHRR